MTAPAAKNVTAAAHCFEDAGSAAPVDSEVQMSDRSCASEASARRHNDDSANKNDAANAGAVPV
jgi:hypothetical protein